jgi:hypothetical protein
MTFRVGDPKPQTSGRRAGVRNKRTRDLRAALEATAREIGGEARLVQWIKASAENERDFWVRMFTRLLPVQVQGSGEHGEVELNVNLTREEVARKIEERGLPASLSGARPPPPPPGDPTLKQSLAAANDVCGLR